jgi:hypothetical protein
MNATDHGIGNVWEQLQAMAQGVAAVMGYTVKPRSESNHGGFAEIVRPDGRGFSLNCAGGLAPRGKIHISGSFPDRIDGRQAWRPASGVSYPSINVAADKPAATVAKEIERRLMPDYLPLLAECREHIARWSKVAEETARTAAQLAEGVGGTVDSRDSSFAHVKVPGVYIKVAVTGSRVRFDGFSVGPKVAAQILALVVASERESD